MNYLRRGTNLRIKINIKPHIKAKLINIKYMFLIKNIININISQNEIVYYIIRT